MLAGRIYGLEVHMDKQQYSYAQLGMLFGIFVGGGLGVVLFASTGNAAFFALAGAGLAVGLALGTGIDQQQ
jgi:hypothetical protein